MILRREDNENRASANDCTYRAGRENRIARLLEVELSDLSMELSVSQCQMLSKDFNDPTTDD